jgi:hypothetical protein
VDREDQCSHGDERQPHPEVCFSHHGSLLMSVILTWNGANQKGCSAGGKGAALQLFVEEWDSLMGFAFQRRTKGPEG